MNLGKRVRVHGSEGGCKMDAFEVKRKRPAVRVVGTLRRTTFMKTLMTSLFVAGTALMAAQTGNTPAPAASSSTPASTTAPVKVKKHHKKAKTVAPAAATTNAVPSTPAAPAKK
jgi:flagellar motor protein MotB